MKKVEFGNILFNTDLIIFDKDGTLTDFKKTWLPIINKRLELILKNIDTDFPDERIKVETYRSFGIFNNFIDPYGPFPYSTPWEDEIIFATVLYPLGIPWQKAKNIAHNAIKQAEKELDRTMFNVLHKGIKEVLVNLKKNGILISVATADLTEIANSILKITGIYDLFDYVIGADHVNRDKPDPEMIYKTVETLKVDKSRVAFIGDSITDMEMGKNAGIGLVVGVLEGGISSRKDLERDADVIIDSVRDIKVL